MHTKRFLNKKKNQSRRLQHGGMRQFKDIEALKIYLKIACATAINDFKANAQNATAPVFSALFTAVTFQLMRSHYIVSDATAIGSQLSSVSLHMGSALSHTMAATSSLLRAGLSTISIPTRILGSIGSVGMVAVARLLDVVKDNVNQNCSPFGAAVVGAASTIAGYSIYNALKSPEQIVDTLAYILTVMNPRLVDPASIYVEERRARIEEEKMAEASMTAVHSSIEDLEEHLRRVRAELEGMVANLEVAVIEESVVDTSSSSCSVSSPLTPEEFDGIIELASSSLANSRVNSIAGSQLSSRTSSISSSPQRMTRAINPRVLSRKLQEAIKKELNKTGKRTQRSPDSIEDIKKKYSRKSSPSSAEMMEQADMHTMPSAAAPAPAPLPPVEPLPPKTP